MTHLKQQKITWFLLVLQWAVDVSHASMAQCSTTSNHVIFAVLDVSLNNGL